LAANVVIIEDQRLVAEFFVLHCRAIGLVVDAACGTLREGLAAVRRHQPGLVLLDFSLPDGSGLDAAKTMLMEFPEMRIIGISSHRDPWTMLQVQRLGLHGFVDKLEQRPEILTEAIRAVLAGRMNPPPACGAIRRRSFACCPTTRSGFFP
jgi:DNA-binding NarL/FixJ family response regulator